MKIHHFCAPAAQYLSNIYYEYVYEHYSSSDVIITSGKRLNLVKASTKFNQNFLQSVQAR